MITRNDLKFNCAESTLIRINDDKPVPDFGPTIMRVASNFGGGVAGWGGICGAASGAIMALGLMYGTNGTESAEEFTEKRARLRSISQEFLGVFEAKFESINCVALIGTDPRTEEGKKRYEQMKENGELHCGDYVEWAANYILMRT